MEATKDTSHLVALGNRLSHERVRLESDPDNKLRQVWVAGIEREIAREREHLGMTENETRDLSTDDLASELKGMGF